MSPTCPPLADADWPGDLAAMREGFAGKLNVYRVMAHHPALLAAWASLRNHVVSADVLGKQLSEVAILRTGHHMRSRYEWSHHVSRGRACGMSDARIASIAGEAGQMSAEDATVATAVDELFGQGRLAPETLASLASLVGMKGVFDVMTTVGLYSTLGYIVNTFETPLDQDIAAELAARPLSGGS